MNSQLELFSLSLDDLGSVVRERSTIENDAGNVGLAATLELAEAMAVARQRIPGNQAYGEWWAGTGVNYSRRWRATLVNIGKRWIDEGRPVVKLLHNGTGERFSLERYAAGGAPYESDATADDDDLDDVAAPAMGNDEWFTPSWLFHALGLTFDLDVCSPADATHVTVPAAQRYALPDNDGLTDPWSGLVWCNPPYSDASGWAARMIEHGNGLFLSHVPINGGWCLDLWRTADALTQFQGMYFVRPDGTEQRPAWWLQLCAYGPVATAALTALPGRLPSDMNDRWKPGPVWVR